MKRQSQYRAVRRLTRAHGTACQAIFARLRAVPAVTREQQSALLDLCTVSVEFSLLWVRQILRYRLEGQPMDMALIASSAETVARFSSALREQLCGSESASHKKTSPAGPRCIGLG